MKLVFTRDVPKKQGYYWWTNFGEHTPTILYVHRDHSTKKLWASNDEFCFKIESVKKSNRIKIEDCAEMDGAYIYAYGDELWCYIPDPWLPNETKQIPPSNY